VRVREERAAFTEFFPDFKWSEDVKKLNANAISCVRDAFKAEEKHGDKRTIYSYETCATDTACVARVFEAVADIFLTKNLETFI
jgi:hypothetical protein